MAVGLQRSQQDVNQPQRHEQQGREHLASPRPAQLATGHRRPPPVQQGGHAHHGQGGEEGDGEGQVSRVHLKRLALGAPGDGGDGPRHADSEKDVDSVGARHVADGGVGVLVLDGGDLAGERVWMRNREKKLLLFYFMSHFGLSFEFKVIKPIRKQKNEARNQTWTFCYFSSPLKMRRTHLTWIHSSSVSPAAYWHLPFFSTKQISHTL